MGDKRSSSEASASVSKRRCSVVTLQTKLDVLRRFDTGDRVVNTAALIGIPVMTVRTIKANKDKDNTLDMLLLLSQQWMEILNAGHEIRARS